MSYRRMNKLTDLIERQRSKSSHSAALVDILKRQARQNREKDQDRTITRGRGGPPNLSLPTTTTGHLKERIGSLERQMSCREAEISQLREEVLKLQKEVNKPPFYMRELKKSPPIKEEDQRTIHDFLHDGRFLVD